MFPPTSSSGAEAYGLLQPRLWETLSYFAEGQTPSVEAAAENLGEASEKGTPSFLTVAF